MYHRGTLSEFNTWHNNVKIILNLPKIGYVNNQLAPQNEHTIAYVDPIQNPNKSDDYIWNYAAYPIDGKIQLSQMDINNLDWFVED